jgi:phospholipid/cholesterol/gamma-HCH transport system ATP-binding protein
LSLTESAVGRVVAQEEGHEKGAPIIEFRGVTKKFGSHLILNAVDLSIRRGEVMVIMGGSGTGKSGSLRHMNGLERADEGRIVVDGHDITDLSEDDLSLVRRKIGMLFQGGALFDSMTVFENVAFALREHTSMTEKQIVHRVEEVLGYVNLGRDIERQLPSALSGGMRKRVSLARTVALKPEVLLYDEPTTGLDPVTSMTINRLIRDLNQRLSTTSVVVTHDITSALFVADRIAFLKSGRFIFTGTPAEAKASEVADLRAFLRPEEHVT